MTIEFNDKFTDKFQPEIDCRYKNQASVYESIIGIKQ